MYDVTLTICHLSHSSFQNQVEVVKWLKIVKIIPATKKYIGYNEAVILVM